MWETKQFYVLIKIHLAAKGVRLASRVKLIANVSPLSTRLTRGENKNSNSSHLAAKGVRLVSRVKRRTPRDHKSHSGP